MRERFHNESLETQCAYCSWHRSCAAAKTDMPVVLAPLCRDRFVSRTRFSYWDRVLAPAHRCLSNSDACGSWLSSEAAPRLRCVRYRRCCFGGNSDRQVLPRIESHHVHRRGFSRGRIRVGCVAPPCEFSRVSELRS